MATSESQGWQRSTIGITPLTVRPRVGKKMVTKRNDLMLFKKSTPKGLSAGAKAERAGGCGGVDRVCSVCTRHVAGYSCPRCLIAYCSSKCYKAHGSGCTEAFFREHVENETRLRDAEEHEGKSSRHRRQQTGPASAGSENHTDGGIESAAARRAKMVEVLRRLRHKANSNQKSTKSTNLSSLPSTCLSSFSSADGDGGGATSPRRNVGISHRDTIPMSARGSASSRPARKTLDEGEDRRGLQDVEDRSDNEVTSSLQLRDERLQELAHALGAREVSRSGRTSSTAATARNGNWTGRAEWQNGAGGLRNSNSGVSGTSLFERYEEGRRDAKAKAMMGLTDGGMEKELEDNEMMNLLTDEERAHFLREVASGRLGKLIVPWIPWWIQTAALQEIHSGNTSNPGKIRQIATTTIGGSMVASPTKSCGSMCSSSSTSNSASSLSSRASASPTEPSTPEENRTESLLTTDIDPNSFTTIPRVIPGVMSQGLDSAENEVSCARHTLAALTADILLTPEFSTLSARAPSPALPALAADLAYAYVSVARLYNGCWCADPVGASLALVGASPVLRDGATPSSVAQAVCACVERAVELEGVRSRSYAESLRKDVLALLEDHRKLTCALQDAWAMLDAAGKSLAPHNSSSREAARSSSSASCFTSSSKIGDTEPKPSGKSSSSSSNATTNKRQRKQAGKELGRVGKRVGYFLLWARSHGAEVTPVMAADMLAAEVNRPESKEVFLDARSDQEMMMPFPRLKLR